MTTRFGQMLPLRKYCKMMKTSKFSLAKYSWSGTATTVCKHGCTLLIETMYMILFDNMLLRILFWMSKDILQLCWQPCMKSIGKFYIFKFFLFGFLFFKLFVLLDVYFLYLIIFVLFCYEEPKIPYFYKFCFKALVNNYFCILKNLSPKKTFPLLMPEKIQIYNFVHFEC